MAAKKPDKNSSSPKSAKLKSERIQEPAGTKAAAKKEPGKKERPGPKAKLKSERIQ